MTLFLTSSPFVDGAPGPVLSNDNGFLDRIREALPPYCRLLFVCSDPERHDLTCQFAADVFSAFYGAGIFFSSLNVLDGENGRDAEALVRSSDFIVLAGGHVPTQNAFFQDVHLSQLLEGFCGVVMGISAGSMNCAEDVYVQPEEEGESAPDFERSAPGLALTDVNILPHYQKVKDNVLDGRRLFEDITYADSWGRMLFPLPDGSYFLQDDEDLLLFGEGWLLQDGELTKINDNGQVFDLSRLDT